MCSCTSVYTHTHKQVNLFRNANVFQAVWNTVGVL